MIVSDCGILLLIFSTSQEVHISGSSVWCCIPDVDMNIQFSSQLFQPIMTCVRINDLGPNRMSRGGNRNAKGHNQDY